MSQRCFSQFLYHTKLIGAFVRGQISDFLEKIRKTVHFGVIFTVQTFEPNASSSLAYGNTDGIKTREKTIQVSGPENKNVNIF